MDELELGWGLESQGQVLYLMNTKQRRLTGAKNSCLVVEILLNSKQDLISNLLCNWQYPQLPHVPAELICVGIFQREAFCSRYYSLDLYMELPFQTEK